MYYVIAECVILIIFSGANSGRDINFCSNHGMSLGMHYIRTVWIPLVVQLLRCFVHHNFVEGFQGCFWI